MLARHRVCSPEPAQAGGLLWAEAGQEAFLEEAGRVALDVQARVWGCSGGRQAGGMCRDPSGLGLSADRTGGGRRARGVPGGGGCVCVRTRGLWGSPGM